MKQPKNFELFYSDGAGCRKLNGAVIDRYFVSVATWVLVFIVSVLTVIIFVINLLICSKLNWYFESHLITNVILISSQVFFYIILFVLYDKLDEIISRRSRVREYFWEGVWNKFDQFGRKSIKQDFGKNARRQKIVRLVTRRRERIKRIKSWSEKTLCSSVDGEKKQVSYYLLNYDSEESD